MKRNKITALIVDDEALGRDVVRHMLRPHTDVQVLAECSDGEQALAAIKRVHPDLVFLDIQMPKLDGLALVQRLQSDGGPLVVFITAFDSYAIRAIEAQALDYLLKPFDQERFDAMLARVRQRLAQLAEASLGRNLRDIVESHTVSVASSSAVTVHSAVSKYEARLVVKETSRVIFVRVEEVIRVEACGNYVELHTQAGRTHLIQETLTAMEVKLDPTLFLRIHRSTLVNIARVKQLEPHFNGEFVVVLDDGSKAKLSRTYVHRAKCVLGLA